MSTAKSPICCTTTAEQDESLLAQISKIEHSFRSITPDVAGKDTLVGGIYIGDIEIVKHAVEVDPRCAMTRSSCGAYPIHLACLLGHLAIVEFGISIATRCAHCETHDGILPLHAAAYAGHRAICEVLVGTDISTVTTPTKSGHGPEDAARIGGHIILSEWLRVMRTEYEDTLQSTGASLISEQAGAPQYEALMNRPITTNLSTPNLCDNINPDTNTVCFESNMRSTDIDINGPDIRLHDIDAGANDTSNMETHNYLIAEFQRASLLEEETDHALEDKRTVGMTESITFNVSGDLVHSVAPGGYHQLGQRPYSTNNTSVRLPGSQLYIPPALPLSFEPQVQASSFLYKPAVQKVAQRTRPFTTKNVYSPRRLGTAAGERERPNDNIELHSGMDEAMMEPESVCGTSQTTTAHDANTASLIVTSASGAHSPGINLNKPSNTIAMYDGSPNATHRTVKHVSSPYASPRSPATPHGAHSSRISPRLPARAVVSDVSVESVALQNPHNYAAYPVSYYAAVAEQTQHADASPDDALVREIITLRAAPMPRSQQHDNQTSNVIWASSLQPVYSLRRPSRPASSRASKRSPNGSIAENSAKSNNVTRSGVANSTLAHRNIVSHRSFDAGDNSRNTEDFTAGVLQNRPIRGVHTLPQKEEDIQTAQAFANTQAQTTATLAQKEKIIIPRLNIGEMSAPGGVTGRKDPNTHTSMGAKQDTITFTRGVPVHTQPQQDHHTIQKKGFAPSPVLRATHNHDLLLSPAHKQRINLTQMVHTVERIVSDPQYSPPVQPLPLLPNTNNNTVHNNPLNAHHSQLPRNERYNIYVDFSHAHNAANGTHDKPSKVVAHSVVMPSVTIETHPQEVNETKSAADSP